ncbi:MAG TPA: hypothetical protein VGO58_06345 [Chitinophagaceae bacterium]|nr:hypothetical protein [Chitinophagaceae bacterium]
MSSVKMIGIAFALTTTWYNSVAQDAYSPVPIRNDTAIQWSGGSVKLVNLTGNASAQNLKKFYLDKIRAKGVTAYEMSEGDKYPSSYRLFLPSLGTQDWLNGLGIELPETKSRKEWYFYDKTMPKDNPDRYRYRAGSEFSVDSCCGCDEAGAFRVKQKLEYKNGKFFIYNIWLSPLCARKAGSPVLEWYPLCNLAYSKPGREFPGVGNGIIYLDTDIIDYEFGKRFPSPFDTVLMTDRPDIGSLLYQDILKGDLRPLEIESGKPLDIKKLLTTGMGIDTVMDVDDDGNVTRYRAVQNLRSSSDFSRLRITQDFYFDFTNERLYSVVRSVVIVLPVLSYDGTLRGYFPFCRLE